MSGRLYVKYEEMMRYLGGNAGSRSVIEGECVLNAGLIMLVGTRGKSTGAEINIISLVLQTSGLTKEPLQVSGALLINEEGEVLVKNMSCSCKAGNSEKCKHVSATIWYLNRNDLAELEELSSTDIKCLWTQKHRKMAGINYSAKKIKDFCHVKQEEESEDMPAGFGELCLERLLLACPRSALALHTSGRIQEIDEPEATTSSEPH